MKIQMPPDKTTENIETVNFSVQWVQDSEGNAFHIYFLDNRFQSGRITLTKQDADKIATQIRDLQATHKLAAA